MLPTITAFTDAISTTAATISLTILIDGSNLLPFIKSNPTSKAVFVNSAAKTKIMAKHKSVISTTDIFRINPARITPAAK